MGKGCHENLHIKVVCLRNYLNCEKGIKERTREKDTLRLQVVEKQSGDAQGHLRNDYISSTFRLHFVYIFHRGSIGHKMDCWRNTSGEINVGLICEISKIPENVNDLGPTVSVRFI